RKRSIVSALLTTMPYTTLLSTLSLHDALPILNHPQATQETLTKYGAFIGDVGFLNELGALTIVGRKNNLMITGGHNVYPEEVEQVIKQSPAVKEAVVVGLADQHWGERIVALIEWKDECHPNLASVKNLCKKH